MVSASHINTILYTHSHSGERGRSKNYTKWVKHHFLFKDYLPHTTSENSQQSPSFHSLCKILGKNSEKSKMGTNCASFIYIFFCKYGICNQRSNTRREL